MLDIRSRVGNVKDRAGGIDRLKNRSRGVDGVKNWSGKCEGPEGPRGGGVFENIKVFLKNQKHETNIVEITHLCIMHGAHTSYI
jgi:hypothetical protein